MKALIIILCLGFTLPAFSRLEVGAYKILDGATATGAGSSFRPIGVKRTYQAVASTSSGTVSVEVDIEVSNDCVNFEDIDDSPMSITGASTNVSYTAGKVSDAAWKCVRANVNSISASNSVSVYLGEYVE